MTILLERNHSLFSYFLSHMIAKALWWILIYSLLIYAVIVWWPQWDFYPLTISPAAQANNIGIFLLLGIALRLVYDVIRYVVKLVTLPLNWLTLGILHILINILILYLMPWVFTALQTGVTITMWSLLEVALFSLGLGIVRGFIK